MSDYISRADAIEVLQQFAEDEKPTDEMSKQFQQYQRGRHLAFLQAVEEIKALPSADAVQIPIKLEKRYPESKDEDITDAFMRGYLAGRSSADAEWIPCSERLPSMRTEVIYSFDGIVSTGYMTDRDFNGEKMELHWEDLESGATIEPIAWMPLPKPYREESEVEE